MIHGEIPDDFPSTPDQAQQLSDIVLTAVEKGVVEDFEFMAVEASIVPEEIRRRFQDDYIFTYDPDDLSACSTEGTIDDIEVVQLNRQLLGLQPLHVFRQSEMTTLYSVELRTYNNTSEPANPLVKSMLDSMFGPPEESQYSMVAGVYFERRDVIEGLFAQVRQSVGYTTWVHQHGGTYIDIDDVNLDSQNHGKAEVDLTAEGRLLRDIQEHAKLRDVQMTRQINDLERFANGQPTFQEVYDQLRQDFPPDEAEWLRGVSDSNRSIDEIMAEERLMGYGVICAKEAAAIIELVQRVAQG